MIRISHELSIIRFYDKESDDMIPYAAVGTIVWESDSIVWIKALHGTITRAMLRELVHTLQDLGVRFVKAKREEGRSLPFSEQQTDGTFLIDLLNIVKQKPD